MGNANLNHGGQSPFFGFWIFNPLVKDYVYIYDLVNDEVGSGATVFASMDMDEQFRPVGRLFQIKLSEVVEVPEGGVLEHAYIVKC